jgi:putative flippase GtrA
MESRNATPITHLVSRAIAFALAGLVATFVSLGSAAIVTQGADQNAQAVYQVAVAVAKKEIRFG